MARRGLLDGQLNMFDFFGENDREGEHEVEMVSLMPKDEPPAVKRQRQKREKAADANEVQVSETVVDNLTATDTDTANGQAVEVETVTKVETTKDVLTVQPKWEASKKGDPVLHQEVCDASGKVVAEISYLDYNKVYLQRRGETGFVKSFETSTEAVDNYIEEMLLLKKK